MIKWYFVRGNEKMRQSEPGLKLTVWGLVFFVIPQRLEKLLQKKVFVFRENKNFVYRNQNKTEQLKKCSRTTNSLMILQVYFCAGSKTHWRHNRFRQRKIENKLIGKVDGVICWMSFTKSIFDEVHLEKSSVCKLIDSYQFLVGLYQKRRFCIL